MLGGPTAAGHNDRPGPQLVDLALVGVGNVNEFALPGRALMFHAHNRRAETDACTLAWLIEGVEIHAASTDRLECTWAGYRRWKQGLYDVARETAIASGKGLQSCLFAVIHRVATEAKRVGGEHVGANSETIPGAGKKKFPDRLLAQSKLLNHELFHGDGIE
jgi:hypothetical protein